MGLVLSGDLEVEVFGAVGCGRDSTLVTLLDQMEHPKEHLSGSLTIVFNMEHSQDTLSHSRCKFLCEEENQLRHLLEVRGFADWQQNERLSSGRYFAHILQHPLK